MKAFLACSKAERRARRCSPIQNQTTFSTAIIIIGPSDTVKRPLIGAPLHGNRPHVDRHVDVNDILPRKQRDLLAKYVDLKE